MPRVTTDAGNLLRKSPSAISVGVQRRTPIVNDPRVRGSRVGQLAASGSYWVPARIDLDTMLSKIDSRIIDEMTVVKGPYSVRYGPGLNFIDVELLKSPRHQSGFQSHASTSVDYKANGQQVYGRQSVSAGTPHAGFRLGYGHTTGNDYYTGDGVGIPASYKSRDIDFALGADPSADSSLEFSYLRLDQTDVEYAGMVFDMDYLVTDGFELSYVLQDQPYFDLFSLDVWYNETRFFGNAQQPGKRRIFPYLDIIRYVGYTDVDSTSTGFRAAATWGYEESPSLTAGVDLRHLRQALNEISSGSIAFNIWTDANSPLPRSEWTNPGLFLETSLPVHSSLMLTGGVRVDLLGTRIIEDVQRLQRLGLQPALFQYSLADVLGTDEFARNFSTWSGYLVADYRLNPHWQVIASAGHGERPPSLTELYVAESFLFLLQNGMNTATGDPRLKPERLTQLDLALHCEFPRFRAGINGFCAWIEDYITFENLGVVTGPPSGQTVQVNLKYVNTDLATLAGFELYGEYDATGWLSPFATLRYVEGQDHTRNGDFDTVPVVPGNPPTPSTRTPGVPRGTGNGSGIVGASSEPLPSILPLESRLGLRFGPAERPRRWATELSARVVADQNRVATSLLETSTPGFAVWDLRTYWYATDSLLLVAGVENFGNRKYREHLDFRAADGTAVFQPGANFYFGGQLDY